MTEDRNIVSIYDFGLFPYALGDALTWNIHTAIECEQAKRKAVDIYLCVDPKFPANLDQRRTTIINDKNTDLFFTELYSVFGAHPKLGDIHIFRSRERLIARLKEVMAADDVNAQIVQQYLDVLRFDAASQMFDWAANPHPDFMVPGEVELKRYFYDRVYSQASINDFAARHGRVPQCRPALGCTRDVAAFLAQRESGSRIVTFHMRLRSLDVALGAPDSYIRDSNFIEWYDFLAKAATLHPNVKFVAVGRLQEKPLEFFRLPNVTSLRLLGMGLGHELALMLQSDLFIGTSAGFAQCAFFSETPYFVTKMSQGACNAYAIPMGATKLPFGLPGQELVYEMETSDLLLQLLNKGLGAKPTRVRAAPPSDRRGADDGWGHS